MRVLVINNAEREMEEQFATPLVRIVEENPAATCELVHWSDLGRDIIERDYGAFIASGSSQGDDPMPTVGELYAKLGVLETNRPFFGICTGFHLQAHLRGMPLIRNDRSESGFVDVTVVEGKEGDPIFYGMRNSFGAVQMHNDSILLPPSFELLASTERCEVQLIKSKEFPVFYCSQFHPEQKEEGACEFGPAAQLIRNFVMLALKFEKSKR